MKIYIQQGGLGRYYVYEGESEEHSYYVRSGFLIFRGDYARIFNKLKERELYIKTGKAATFLSLNKATYLIEFIKRQETLEVKCVNYSKGHWAFNFNGQKYDLYLYIEGRKSLYKDQVQVAKYVKVDETYIIVANSDEDVLLLVGLFITFNMGDSMVDADLRLYYHDSVVDYDPKWYPVK